MANNVASRSVPQWFPSAGLGIFIHWGLFSVPAWAPTLAPGQTFPDLLRTDPVHMGERLPYAEWYRNAMEIQGSPTQRHHRETYGYEPYEDFQGVFEAGLDRWDPQAWADLFKASGAGYVVLVTKHHDGYCLWPTEVDHPRRDGWFSQRDLVGELADAVRARGLRFGVYYSTGLDWSVEHRPIRQVVDAHGCIPRDPAYRRYVEDQLEELVQRYEPSVVWADIGAPKGFDLAAFKARLRAKVPDAVVNDRWNAPLPGTGSALGRKVLNGLFALTAGRSEPKPFYPGNHRLADYRTPEYSWPRNSSEVWETTRGMGSAFGFNANEPDEMLVGLDELVADYRAIRAAGGNLLLNVGPMANGVIPDAQAERLHHLGRSLAAEAL